MMNEMNRTMDGFLERNLPKFKDSIDVSFSPSQEDFYEISFSDGRLKVKANCIVSACTGIYDYLKKYCRVQLSWCANDNININSLTAFEGVFEHRIQQKYRVYMNYCTLNYTMSWWDFDRWEKEIDFMAMNGINMPLAVTGTEAVWFETLTELGFTQDEALSAISGPAFWAWQLMTNIEGYLPPKNKKYVYERLELGRKILKRYIEFGMFPVQQGFSGHVPMLMKEKYPSETIYEQMGWCFYPKTAQLDPTSEFFQKVGRLYLKKTEELLGNHHFFACDPFHEGMPPKITKEYLSAVGSAINKMYEDFGSESTWVMQGWTPQRYIVEAVPKERLLIFDLDSDRTAKLYKWIHTSGYTVVTGMLHNFGGKNAMQGHLKGNGKNNFYRLKKQGVNVVGTGMFMEGVEQNPVIYDLQFYMLTADEPVDIDVWLRDYIERRYGTVNGTLLSVWKILLETCYCEEGYEENRVGSCLAARPNLLPRMTGPCCYTKVYYDTEKFERAVKLFFSLHDELQQVESYQYDLCDLLRQALSNRFYNNQKAYRKAYMRPVRDKKALKTISEKQLELLLDLDELLSHRHEMTLSRWINDAHRLASDDEEREYFDLNARTLITLWGDIDNNTALLFDYAWREWSGLIKEYYYKRWKLFYDEVNRAVEKHRILILPDKNGYEQRITYKKYKIGKLLDSFELSWIKKYSDYPEPSDSDVIPSAEKLIGKYSIGGEG